MASIIIGALVLTALYIGTKRLSGFQIIILIAVTAFGSLLVIVPSLATRAANFLNVGRGTDLVFYIAVLAGLFVASNFYFRFKRNEEALIALERRVAMDHVEPPLDVEEVALSAGPPRISGARPSLDTVDPTEP